MRHYCVFKGVNTLDLNLFMENTPAIISPAERVKNLTVPGRSGYIAVSEDAFDGFTRRAEFILRDVSAISDVSALFKGEGYLTFSDEPDMRYYARVANQIEFSRFIKSYRRLAVWFDCQPFKQLREPVPIVLSASGSITNPGTYYSEPVIHISGTAPIVLTVNGSVLNITQLPITLDSVQQEAYYGEQLLNDKVSGELPVFEVGENAITIVGDATLTIEPNWRWF